MPNVYQAYHLPEKGVSQIVADYVAKHGTPPHILHINKVDSWSTFPEGLEVMPEQWVLPSNFFLEILEPVEAENEV